MREPRATTRSRPAERQRYREAFREKRLDDARGGPAPRQQAREDRVALDQNVGGKPGLAREDAGCLRASLVPRSESDNDDAGAGWDHRRVRPIVCRTISPVSAGSPRDGMATPPPRRLTSAPLDERHGRPGGFDLAVTFACADLDHAPRARPGHSRRAVGITIRPAAPTVDFMTVLCHSYPAARHVTVSPQIRILAHRDGDRHGHESHESDRRRRLHGAAPDDRTRRHQQVHQGPCALACRSAGLVCSVPRSGKGCGTRTRDARLDRAPCGGRR